MPVGGATAASLDEDREYGIFCVCLIVSGCAMQTMPYGCVRACLNTVDQRPSDTDMKLLTPGILIIVATALSGQTTPNTTADRASPVTDLAQAAVSPMAGAPITRSEAAPPDPAATASTTSQASTGVSSNSIESSMFSSLFMAGKTQDQFRPLTPKESLKVYEEDLFNPIHVLMAGAAAGISQLQNVPPEWGQGCEGYARRFGNYYAYAGVSDILQMAGEDLLREDNLYYGSGEHSFWKRTRYAIKSSVLARGGDGSRHVSISQIGSTAGAAFISRLWQPRSNDSAGDGATSFGISMATNAGVNVVREFLPDITRHIFHGGRE